MRIAIRAISIGPESGAAYLNNLIEWFGRNAPEKEFILIGNSRLKKTLIPTPGNFKYSFHRISFFPRVVLTLWEKYRLSGIIEKLGCDMVFDPGKGSVSEWSYPGISIRKKGETAANTRSHGNERLKNLKAENHNRNYRIADRDAMARYGIDGDFILCVSRTGKDKGTTNVIEGYLQRANGKAVLPPMYIVSTDGSSFFAAIGMKFGNERTKDGLVRFPGLLPHDDLTALLRSCSLVILPESFENVEEILAEAWLGAVPVLCANDRRLWELCGWSALMFNPDYIEDISFKIHAVMEDFDLGAFLKIKAREKAGEVIWDRAAESVLRSIDHISAGSLPNPVAGTAEMIPESQANSDG